jgi:hypothetical protein
MKRLALLFAALAALALAGTASATPVSNGGTDSHQVWVCKYVGAPGDFETLKPGKNPIIVDVAAADAYVGADFADGQTHSLVIDIATDENTGQGERYTGEATCPSDANPDPSATPTSSPSDEPSPSPKDVPSGEPSPVPSPTHNAVPTPDRGPLPPTDMDSGTTSPLSPLSLNATLLVLLLAGSLGSIGALAISKRR